MSVIGVLCGQCGVCIKQNIVASVWSSKRNTRPDFRLCAYTVFLGFGLRIGWAYG